MYNTQQHKFLTAPSIGGGTEPMSGCKNKIEKKCAFVGGAEYRKEEIVIIATSKISYKSIVYLFCRRVCCVIGLLPET